MPKGMYLLGQTALAIAVLRLTKSISWLVSRSVGQAASQPQTLNQTFHSTFKIL